MPFYLFFVLHTTFAKRYFPLIYMAGVKWELGEIPTKYEFHGIKNSSRHESIVRRLIYILLKTFTSFIQPFKLEIKLELTQTRMLVEYAYPIRLRSIISITDYSSRMNSGWFADSVLFSKVLFYRLRTNHRTF